MAERSDRPLPPGSTVGVLGTGQLGRMLVLAARRAGYRTVTLGDGPSPTPCGQVADVEMIAAYDDPAALAAFRAAVDVVTIEFENVPAASLDTGPGLPPARPSARVAATCQNRAREKAFLRDAGVPTVRWSTITSPGDVNGFGFPAVVKTAAFGYDGKGQWRVGGADDLGDLPDDVELVVEELVDLTAECSVLVARGTDGEVVTYPLIENHHTDHILDWSVAPARLPADVAAAADSYARRIAEAFDLVGVLAVELFVTGRGDVVVNELAPRPHNSGHLTIEAAPTSQFEQQLRAACGLPLGATAPFRPSAMANLLGDLWVRAGGEPDWAAALAVPGVTLHLYGKTDPRPGRKMGHLTALADTPDDALDRVLAARSALVH
jgi:5-(carboxyamino)imidazole ribonucleotide synthase